MAAPSRPFQGYRDREKILIVEDDEAVAAGIAASLDATLDVDTCGSAEEALRMIARTRYAVVCADFGLPGMSGLRLLQELAHAEDPPRGLLITGSAESYATSKRGGYHVLLKPFDPARLVSTIAHLLRLEAMRRTVTRTLKKMDA